MTLKDETDPTEDFQMFCTTSTRVEEARFSYVSKGKENQRDVSHSISRMERKLSECDLY